MVLGRHPMASNPSWVVARCPGSIPKSTSMESIENQTVGKPSITLPWSCIWFWRLVVRLYSPAFSLKPQAQPPNIVLIPRTIWATPAPTIRNPHHPLISIVWQIKACDLPTRTSSTVCTSTRYSILTGRMAERGFRGVRWSGVPRLIESDVWTLPGMLRDQGLPDCLLWQMARGLTFSTHKELRSTRTD